MLWMKITAAAVYAGKVSAKLLYDEIRAGRLMAARIGAGRNLLTCDEWLDQWLRARAERSD